MSQRSFVELLHEGQHSNSLLNVDKVVAVVLVHPERLEELYQCLFDEDAWVRMRAADGLEKICRQRPELLRPYIDRLNKNFAGSAQPSILWHLAQMYTEVDLNPKQQDFALAWLGHQLRTTDVDWIVAANCMTAVVDFHTRGAVTTADVKPLLTRQLKHRSPAVIKRAKKLLAGLD